MGLKDLVGKLFGTKPKPEQKPQGFMQYPAPPGQTEYGTYQNPNK
jgi:hypothetical protein